MKPHPGCLGCIDGQVCAVHRDLSRAKTCLRCGGRGYYAQSNATVLGGRPIDGACPICAGTGILDKRRSVPKPRKVPMSERPLMQMMDTQRKRR